MIDEAWHIIKEKLIFDARPWLEVVRQTVKLPSGIVVDDFYQIKQPDYVEIVAVNDQGKIQGMWHYKHGVGRVHLGLPAGYLETNEEPLTAAKRELLEECQLESSNWTKLGEFTLEGNRGPAKGHFYFARNCEPSFVRLYSDDIEPAEMVWLTIQEWMQHIANGDVAVIGAATALLLAEKQLRGENIT